MRKTKKFGLSFDGENIISHGIAAHGSTPEKGKNAIKPIDNKEHQHGLTLEQIKMLPGLIANPVMVMDSLVKDDSIIVVTSEIDPKMNEIYVKNHMNKQKMCI